MEEEDAADHQGVQASDLDRHGRSAGNGLRSIVVWVILVIHYLGAMGMWSAHGERAWDGGVRAGGVWRERNPANPNLWSVGRDAQLGAGWADGGWHEFTGREFGGRTWSSALVDAGRAGVHRASQAIRLEGRLDLRIFP